MKRLFRWLDERIQLTPIKVALFDRKIPKGVGWIYVLGSASLAIFLLQAATGILLAMNYSPSPDHAHESVRFIMESVPMGSVVRGLHKWGATLMVIVVTLHMIRVYFMGAYKYPRESTWIIGVFIWAIVMLFGFTGYLLPWDQKAYWATMVGTQLATQVPVAGQSVAKVLRGGETLGAVTLSRFYAFHVLLLPAIVVILIGVHLFLVIRQGISAPPEKDENYPEDWKEAVHRRYLELKEQGKSFFPYIIFKDTLGVAVVFVIVFVLAFLKPAELEEIADPTDTTYNPRPEWYFLFLFQALKFFPGSLEPVAAVLLPAVAGLFLISLPFIDRGPKRHALNRPWLTGLGGVVLAGVVWLTVQGAHSPLLNPVVAKDPQVTAGRRLYSELRCYYCHSIQGKGGLAAPDLSTVGARRDRDWLIRHFQDPKQVTPGSIMPKLNLLPEEADQLAAFLATLGGGGPFTPQAPVLFEQHCATCHRIDGKGGEIGPDLTAVRSYRDKAYLYAYMGDPQKMNPNATMPGFKGTLTDAQLEDLSRYLLSSQRVK